MSWTLSNESEVLHEAILHTCDQGAVLVAWAGELSLTTGLGTVACPAADRRSRRQSGRRGRAEAQPLVPLWRDCRFLRPRVRPDRRRTSERR